MNVIAKNTSSLYFLVFPERGLLKIGKANNIRTRGKKLSHSWGDADYEESFELVAPQATVFRLEKSLHFMLSAYSANAEGGDGCTEMFSLDALDIAIKYVELFTTSSKKSLTLKKGMPKPVISTHERRTAAFSMRLTTQELDMLKHIAETTPDSMHAFCVKAIRRALALD